MVVELRKPPGYYMQLLQPGKRNLDFQEEDRCSEHFASGFDAGRWRSEEEAFLKRQRIADRGSDDAYGDAAVPAEMRHTIDDACGDAAHNICGDEGRPYAGKGRVGCNAAANGGHPASMDSSSGYGDAMPMPRGLAKSCLPLGDPASMHSSSGYGHAMPMPRGLPKSNLLLGGKGDGGKGHGGIGDGGKSDGGKSGGGKSGGGKSGGVGAAAPIAVSVAAPPIAASVAAPPIAASVAAPPVEPHLDALHRIVEGVNVNNTLLGSVNNQLLHLLQQQREVMLQIQWLTQAALLNQLQQTTRSSEPDPVVVTAARQPASAPPAHLRQAVITRP